MLERSFQRFADEVIVLRNRIRTDPFFITRVQLMLLYFAIGVAIFIVFGWYLSALSFEPVYEAANLVQTDSATLDAIDAYEHASFQRRLLLTLLFTVATYFLTQFAMRPVRKSVELQERFIAIVSHELRTPLTVMKNMSEIALRNPQALDLAKATKIIKSNLEETDRLSDTIRFLVAFSGLKIQRKIPDVQLVSLVEVAKKTLSGIQKDADIFDVSLTIEDSIPGVVRGNPAALEGLLTNLIRNAVFHTPRGGSVTVSIDEFRGRIRLMVIDTGKGIAKKDLPYIFEPFYQGQSGAEHEHSHKGLGLGLSIVKEVAELHRGRVSVRSHEGSGTTFTVLFPKA